MGHQQTVMWLSCHRRRSVISPIGGRHGSASSPLMQPKWNMRGKLGEPNLIGERAQPRQTRTRSSRVRIRGMKNIIDGIYRHRNYRLLGTQD